MQLPWLPRRRKVPKSPRVDILKVFGTLPYLTPYVMLFSPKSYCPNCGSNVYLLTPNQLEGFEIALPSFWVCPVCGHIAQNAVGPVPRIVQ